MITPVNRGDIFLVDLDPVRGSEQGKTRPCVVIQNNLGNLHSSVTIIVAGTSKTERAYPTDVIVDAETCGLDYDTKFMCNQIRTVSKDRLQQRK